MKTRYDWKEIDEKTNSKARWAATNYGTVFASDKKPFYEIELGWCVDPPCQVWIIGKTGEDDKTLQHLTCEKRIQDNTI